MEWWQSLDSTVRAFYSVAIFFSILFLWQFVMSMVGLVGGDDVETDGDCDVDADGDFDGDGHEAHAHAGDSSNADFKLLSLRSIVAFGMLFGWATGMYLQNDMGMNSAILCGIAWGTAAMFIVAGGFYLMKKFTEIGTATVGQAVGNTGTVTLDIPADGSGEVRVMVQNQLQHVAARSEDNAPIKASTIVTVTNTLGNDTVIVQPISKGENL